MDFNLIISAQKLRLAPDLLERKPGERLLVIKNVPARTYLRITPEQWFVLRQFAEERNVPTVLNEAIRERFCLPLGEFYELILKAVRAHVLLGPGTEPPTVKASGWHGEIRATTLSRPLAVLFFVGLILAFGFQPDLPSSPVGAAAGLAILIVAHSVAALLAGCVIRGENGDVYHPRWSWRSLPPRFTIDPSDMILLPRRAQDVILTVEPAILATAAGLATWHWPEWSFFPLLGLMFSLRPIFGGRFASVVRLGNADPEGDTEHGFLFPPNRGPRARWRALCHDLREANTWVTVAYSVIWTLAIIYLAARLTDTPPWSIRYWEANGVRIAVAILGSLALLAAGYLAWEAYQFIRDRADEWRFGFREWHGRWIGGSRKMLDETARLDAIATSPLLRTLPPPQRQQLLQAMQVTRHGPWRTLRAYAGGGEAQVALIVSGRIGLRRHLSSGRRVRTHVLEAGDVIGLHDLADPSGGAFDLRTLTPVTLLTLPRARAEEIFVRRMGAVLLNNIILKLPFLRSISLCENWHQQAIERFATLSDVVAEPDGNIIFVEGLIADRFFIIFEGEAVVSRRKKRVAVVRAGEFFGEIGMMQMSPASATITARGHTRCLAIARTEFMRFVTHNYSVALEIERVSSRRLGHPLFPLTPGDFRAT